MNIKFNLRRFVSKLEKRFGFTLFFIFPLRIFFYLIEIFSTKKKNLLNFANYYLDEKIFEEKNLILISAGIADDITFEQKLYQSFNIEKSVLIDPNDISEEIVKKKLPKSVFVKGAIFDKNGQQKIYLPDDKKNLNLSIANLYDTKNFINVNTYTVKQLCDLHKLQRVSVLKLDVEGVADKVIIDILKNSILPDQICFELERPLAFTKQLDYLKNILRTIKALKLNNYDVYRCTRAKIGLRLEVLAVKKN